VEGSREHRKEPSVSITFGELLEWVLNWRLLMKGSAPWIQLVC
jgi:hypothetical protein